MLVLDATLYMEMEAKYMRRSHNDLLKEINEENFRREVIQPAIATVVWTLALIGLCTLIYVGVIR